MGKGCGEPLLLLLLGGGYSIGLGKAEFGGLGAGLLRWEEEGGALASARLRQKAAAGAGGRRSGAARASR